MEILNGMEDEILCKWDNWENYFNECVDDSLMMVPLFDPHLSCCECGFLVVLLWACHCCYFNWGIIVLSELFRILEVGERVFFMIGISCWFLVNTWFYTWNVIMRVLALHYLFVIMIGKNCERNGSFHTWEMWFLWLHFSVQDGLPDCMCLGLLVVSGGSGIWMGTDAQIGIRVTHWEFQN